MQRTLIHGEAPQEQEGSDDDNGTAGAHAGMAAGLASERGGVSARAAVAQEGACVMTKSMMVAALILSWLYLYSHRLMVVNANVQMHNLSYRSSLAPSLSSHSCLWMSPS
jgi:hypothetical protein